MSCYTELQQFEKAESAYREALRQINLSSRINPKHRCSLLSVNLATILVRQEAVEEACQLSRKALSLVHQSQSPLVLQHLLKFRRELGPWKSLTAVESFDHTLVQVQMSLSTKEYDINRERRSYL
jgi:tetratricopeptide (TPR) repeat protein